MKHHFWRVAGLFCGQKPVSSSSKDRNGRAIGREKGEGIEMAGSSCDCGGKLLRRYPRRPYPFLEQEESECGVSLSLKGHWARQRRMLSPKPRPPRSWPRRCSGRRPGSGRRRWRGGRPKCRTSPRPATAHPLQPSLSCKARVGWGRRGTLEPGDDGGGGAVADALQDEGAVLDDVEDALPGLHRRRHCQSPPLSDLPIRLPCAMGTENGERRRSAILARPIRGHTSVPEAK